MSIDNFSINIEIDNSHSLLSKELVTQEISISFCLPNLVYCQICCDSVICVKSLSWFCLVHLLLLVQLYWNKILDYFNNILFSCGFSFDYEDNGYREANLIKVGQ